MFKKFFSSFLIISILFIVYANWIEFSNFSFNNKNKSLKETYNEEISSYFISNSSNLFWPIPGYHTITSPFGTRISPITKKISTHSGIDIGAQEGSLLYSASDGRVAFTGFNRCKRIQYPYSF